MASELSKDDLVSKISYDLQRLEAELSEKDNVDISVPQGVIRKVVELIGDYSFVQNSTLRRNVCYAVEALDFYRWIINRFNVYGPVSGYLFKTGIILIDMIIEAIVYDFLDTIGATPSKKHSRNICKLEEHGFPRRLCQRIQNLHERRGNVSL